MVRGFLNNYFGFNRQQRTGLTVLMAISFVLLIIRITYPHLMKESAIEVRNLPVALPTDSVFQDSAKYFKFDPNTASAGELLQLGFTEKTISTLIKYRKHHPFRKKEDLLQVYGVSQNLYQRLSPWIVIGSEQGTSATRRPAFHADQKKDQMIGAIELNDADSSSLERLPGIGPVLSMRILKYRSMLGGYVSKQQLLEVYGLTAETFNRMQDHVTVDKNKITPININRDDFKTVNRHPYISYELTKSVFSSRRSGALDSEKLKTIVSNDSIYQKLVPYISY